MKAYNATLLSWVFCMISIISFGQARVNLAAELQEKQIKAVNRLITLNTNHSGAIEMDAAEGSGLGILTEIEVENGTIEVELLGENAPGRSFLGIAFNIRNEDTYEAIYFRPFNFVAEEQIRRSHMVQYIDHPQNTWYKLREERTGEFENEISDPPDPNGWFKAKIIVMDNRVEVYVNEISDPVLKVDRISSTKSPKIGLWTGHGSSGRFRNMVLHPE